MRIMQITTPNTYASGLTDYRQLPKCNSSAYKSAYPDCSSSEAAKYAKASEETVRKEASSLREYHELCTRAAQLLQKSLENKAVHEQPQRIPSGLQPTGVSLGRYADVQHFKDGLFSEIFKARLPEPESAHGQSTIVALKVTTPGMMAPPHDSVREARILHAAGGDHIIQLLETFTQSSGRFVLVFPYMPYDLDVLLRQKELTNVPRRGILKDIFSALAHLHKLDIIHRDIKPSNILLASPTGPAYLADFGIAWSSSDSDSEPADAKILDVGTTCYRPPELLFGNASYDTTLDLWAAGCVAAQVVCLNSKTLFDAGDLGSELALIKSIFETLGTPDLDVWPEAAKLPDWGKMNFRKYPGQPWKAILPDAEPSAVDFVAQLVGFESGDRLKAQDALSHPYLENICRA